MDRMFTREDIDFDKLHGEIKANLLRQKELRSQGVKPSLWGSNEGNAAKWKLWNDRHCVYDWYKKEVPARELGYLTVRITVLCSILNYAKRKHHFKTLEKSFHKHPIQSTDLMYNETPEHLDKLHEKVIGDEWKQFIKVKSVEEVKPEPSTLVGKIKAFFG